MIGFVVRTIVIAIAVAVVAYFYPSISYGDDIATLIAVAVVLGLLNAFVKPILKVFTLPLNMMTFGLFGIVINAVLLLAVAALADLAGSSLGGLEFEFVVGGFPPDFGLDAIVAAVVGRHRDLHRRGDRRPGGARLTGPASPARIDAGLADRLRAAGRRRATPWYALDPDALDAAARSVRDAFPDPIRPPVLGQGQRRPARHPRGRGSRVRGQRRVARRVGQRASGRRPECRDDPGGRRQDPGRPARRGPAAAAVGDPLRWIALESPEEAADLAAMARRAGAPTRRPLPAQPGRRPGDPGRAGRRGRRQQVRDGRDGHRARPIEAGGGADDGPLRPRGIHLHVGSQLGAVDAWREAVRKGLALTALWRGVDRHVRHAGPGRRLPGPAARRAVTGRRPGSPASCRRCSTRSRPIGARHAWPSSPDAPSSPAPAGCVARVLHVRERGGRQVVIDAGMTELIRPALYGARHPIVALTSLGRAVAADAPRDATSRRPASRARSVSRRTRSARTTSRRCERGDLVAIADAGAYAASQASRYNGRPAAPTHPGLTRAILAARCPSVRPLVRRAPPAARSSRRWWLPAAGPPFPSPTPDQAVHDTADVLLPATRINAQGIAEAVESWSRGGRRRVHADDGRGPVDQADG